MPSAEQTLPLMRSLLRKVCMGGPFGLGLASHPLATGGGGFRQSLWGGAHLDSEAPPTPTGIPADLAQASLGQRWDPL